MSTRVCSDSILNDKGKLLGHIEDLLIKQLTVLRQDFKDEIQTLWTKLAGIIKQEKETEHNFNDDTVGEAEEIMVAAEGHSSQNLVPIIDLETSKSFKACKETSLNNEANIMTDYDNTENSLTSSEGISETNLMLSSDIMYVAENLDPWYENIKVEITNKRSSYVVVDDVDNCPIVNAEEGYSQCEMPFQNHEGSQSLDNLTTDISIHLPVANNDNNETAPRVEKYVVPNSKASKNQCNKDITVGSVMFNSSYASPLENIVKCEKVFNNQGYYEKNQCLEVPCSTNASEMTQKASFPNFFPSLSSTSMPIPHQRNSCKEKRAKVHDCNSTIFEVNNESFHQACVPYNKAKQDVNSLKSSKLKHSVHMMQDNRRKFAKCIKEYSPNKHKNSFKCHVCSKNFSTKMGLLGHLKIHKTKNMMYCKICEKSFRNKLEFKCHMHAHRIEHFQCKICGKKHVSKILHQAHLRIHKQSSKSFTTNESSIKQNVFPLFPILNKKSLSTDKMLRMHLKGCKMETRSKIAHKQRYNLRKALFSSL